MIIAQIVGKSTRLLSERMSAIRLPTCRTARQSVGIDDYGKKVAVIMADSAAIACRRLSVCMRSGQRSTYRRLPQ